MRINEYTRAARGLLPKSVVVETFGREFADAVWALPKPERRQAVGAMIRRRHQVVASQASLPGMATRVAVVDNRNAAIIAIRPPARRETSRAMFA